MFIIEDIIVDDLWEGKELLNCNKKVYCWGGLERDFRGINYF